MFSLLVLFACCATIASASPTASAKRTQLWDEIDEGIEKIHVSLEKLFVPSGTYSKFRDKASIKDIIEAALEYARSYLLALRVGSGHYWPSLTDPLDWDLESFHQRVHNFGLGSLRPLEQYPAMARALVELLELVEHAWGGTELKKLDDAWSKLHFHSSEKPPPTTVIAQTKSSLVAKIEELCSVYSLKDVAQPGGPCESSEGHSVKSTLVDGEASASVLALLDERSIVSERSFSLS